MLAKFLQMKNVLERDRFEGLNRKLQLRPLEFDVQKLEDGSEKVTVTEVLLILKWGGTLTHAGVKQAQDFGA